MGSSVLKTTRWPVTIFCSVRLFHSLIQQPGESMAVAKVGISVTVTLFSHVRCFNQWNSAVSDFPSSDCSRGFKANRACPQYLCMWGARESIFLGCSVPSSPRIVLFHASILATSQKLPKTFQNFTWESRCVRPFRQNGQIWAMSRGPSASMTVQRS